MREKGTMSISSSTTWVASALSRDHSLTPINPPVVTDVSFPWTDDELIAKGVHLPLSAKALEYWDEHSSIADDLNFTEARASYTTASVLEPEWLVWTPDGRYVLVSLQENCALVKINVSNAVAVDIYRYVPTLFAMLFGFELRIN
jgi:hypothetical protein